VNLAGIEHSEVGRGDVVVLAGQWERVAVLLPRQIESELGWRLSRRRENPTGYKEKERRFPEVASDSANSLVKPGPGGIGLVSVSNKLPGPAAQANCCDCADKTNAKERQQMILELISTAPRMVCPKLPRLAEENCNGAIFGVVSATIIYSNSQG
jgi:hypothetical protein